MSFYVIDFHDVLWCFQANNLDMESDDSYVRARCSALECITLVKQLFLWISFPTPANGEMFEEDTDESESDEDCHGCTSQCTTGCLMIFFTG